MNEVGQERGRPPLGRYVRLGRLPFVLALAAAALLAFLLQRVLEEAVTERTERDLALALERAAPEFEAAAAGRGAAVSYTHLTLPTNREV